MSRNWWLKFGFLIAVTLGSILYVIPTVSNLDPATTKFPFKQKINMGLDLQGGLYIVMGADFNKVFRDVSDRQALSLEERTKDKGFSAALKKVHVNKDAALGDDPMIQVDFDPAKRQELYDLIKKEYTNLRIAGETPGHFELGLATEYRREVRERTIGQSIEVIRNRIDEFGVAEPSISSQGTDRVVVELPGVKEVDRAKDLIGRTAKLEFKMVDDKSLSPDALAGLVAQAEKDHSITYVEGQKFSEYVAKINDALKSKLPAGTEVLFERGKTQPGQEAGRIPYLVNTRADLTGEALSDASVAVNPEDQRPYVAFSMNPRGAVEFDKLTGESVGKRMAIVLDSIVHSAPVIQSRISGGHGQITLGRSGDGEQIMKEAKDLAIVLRAGALPAQLDMLEQRVVGPSLGQDSIHKGAMASLIGAFAVILFVSLYYRVSGMIAGVSLILNVLYVLAILVGLEATLTLPGIAGIALTVGIAVDSNVVIYERIREELRAGKHIHAAVDAGFQKAFRTIMDANITNAAAATVLMMYGTGPIKGFAVSLLIGIVTTLFTAVFVCRVAFDAYLRFQDQRSAKEISI